jgi:hypothetical protein
MPVLFHTAEALDLRTLSTMGLSAKPNSDTPIGEFGTGLKYAIAILLRLEHKIELWINGVEHTFSTREGAFRGEPFTEILLNNQPLPFTLNYGKNWKLWQAFRELESNTRDENGTSRLIRPDEPVPTSGTSIIVHGLPFEDVFNNKSLYFLNSTPIEKVAGVEIHPQSTRVVYYRGIRVYEADEPFHYTYNILNEISLTEDRTIASDYTLRTEIGWAFHKTNNPEIAERILSQKAKEWDLSHSTLPSGVFLEALLDHAHDANLPYAWLEAIAKERKTSGVAFTPITLTAFEQELVQDAIKLLAPLGVTSDIELIFTETLGNTIHGCHLPATGKIYISRSAFNKGVSHLAAVIYEEYCHKAYDLIDNTREMQSFFLHKLIAITERLSS